MDQIDGKYKNLTLKAYAAFYLLVITMFALFVIVCVMVSVEMYLFYLDLELQNVPRSNANMSIENQHATFYVDTINYNRNVHNLDLDVQNGQWSNVNM